VCVGPVFLLDIDRDTVGFAVTAIRRWWQTMDLSRYQAARSLLACGGNTGARVRLWRLGLPSLADHPGRTITVFPPPPGTSKRNRIGPRLFGPFAQDWRGKPLVSSRPLIKAQPAQKQDRAS
jgi:hypothetical protein